MQKKWKVTFECKLHEKSLFTCLHEFCTILFTIRVWKVHHTFVKSPLFATVLWKRSFPSTFGPYLILLETIKVYFYAFISRFKTLVSSWKKKNLQVFMRSYRVWLKNRSIVNLRNWEFDFMSEMLKLCGIFKPRTGLIPHFMIVLNVRCMYMHNSSRWSKIVRITQLVQEKWKLHEKSLFTRLHAFCTILFTIRVWKCIILLWRVHFPQQYCEKMLLALIQGAKIAKCSFRLYGCQ